MSKIAIDARFYGTEHTGLGRYTKNVLDFLPRALSSHELLVFTSPKYKDLRLGSNVKVIPIDIPHYSLTEQIKLPRLFESYHPDLLYSFHFNVPISLKIPFVVTIHDLIKSHFSHSDTTTRNKLFFQLKRLGYNKTISFAVLKSKAIIVPSNTVKNDVLTLFGVNPTKIRVVYEAPDKIFRVDKIRKEKSSRPYILYVGNSYPHKNLSLLLSAYSKLASKIDHDLVIVSKRNYFLDKVLAPYALPPGRIQIIEQLSDSKLHTLYKEAKLTVIPSLMEGFGLPGLESLLLRTPILVSDIPVFREVYGASATYFNPQDSADLAAKIAHKLSQPSKKQDFSYPRTWESSALEIAEVLNENCPRL